MNRSLRVPPSHAKRSSAASAWPSGVWTSLTSPSIEYGTPSEPSAVSSGFRRARRSGRRSRSAPVRCRPAAARAAPRRRARAPRACRRPRRSGRLRRRRPVQAARRRRARARDAQAQDGRPRRSAAAAPRSRRLRAARGPRPCAAARRMRAGPARRKRDGDLGAPGERLEHCPFGAGQVLEAVREHRCASPRAEIRCEALGRPPPQKVAIPASDPVELGAVGGVEGREVALEVVRVEEPGLELAERLLERVGEAAEAGRGGEPVQACAGERAADEQCPLRPGQQRPRALRRRRRAARRDRRTFRSCPRGARAGGRAARARRARRPPGSARSARAPAPASPDSDRATARPCPRWRAPRSARATPSNRRAAP